MNLKDLLLEYNQAKIINDFGQKLVNKYQTEFPNKKVTPEQVLAKIANLDTTGNKELTFWLAMNYAKDQIKRFEDIGSRAVPNLEKFKVLLRKPNLNPKLPTRDINQIQGLPELEKIIDLYEPKQTESGKELERQAKEEMFKSGQAELVLKDKDITVIVPKTKKAAMLFGQGTRWCTSAKRDNRFDFYNKQGPLYIIMAGGKKYQWHLESGQFMNTEDEFANPIVLAEKYPILVNLLSPYTKGDFWERLMKSPYSVIRKKIAENPNTSPEILTLLAKDRGWSVRREVARNPHTSSEILALLAKDKEWTVRWKVAENPNTSSEILALLAKDEDWGVRSGVALNSKTSPEILALLAKDKNYLVKGQVAKNLNTPRNILYLLAKDENFLVVSWANKNLKLRSL